jgi:hypothetical protein
MYCLHHQGQRVSQARIKQQLCTPLINQMCQANGLQYALLFMKIWVPITAWRPGIATKHLYGFPQSTEANTLNQALTRSFYIFSNPSFTNHLII